MKTIPNYNKNATIEAHRGPLKNYIIQAQGREGGKRDCLVA